MCFFTCPNAPIGQVGGDGDPPFLIDTHALNAAVHPSDQSAKAHLADEGLASVIAVNREESRMRGYNQWKPLKVVK